MSTSRRDAARRCHRHGPSGARSRRYPERAPPRRADRGLPAPPAIRCRGRPRLECWFASRAPVRPATANPIASIMAAAAGVRRLHGSVKPEICSAKVFAAQSAVSQNNRRTRMSIRTGYPPIAVSARCRRDREMHSTRFAGTTWARRPLSPRPSLDADHRSTRRESRTSTLSKCGSKPLPPSSVHPKNPQLPTLVQFSGTPSIVTESPPDPNRHVRFRPHRAVFETDGRWREVDMMRIGPASTSRTKPDRLSPPCTPPVRSVCRTRSSSKSGPMTVPTQHGGWLVIMA
ncbi:hypothetical protein Rruber_04683 [Rhodococcus ruber]